MTPAPTLVSVITVCFNAAGTIARTLDSVRAQSWRPLESVVVDGGSTDGTQAIAARYGDIAGAVVSEPDQGIYDAMNKGIGLASGEILHFLNADDSFVDARVVEEAVRLFDADPELDLVYGDAIYLTGEGSFLRSYRRVNARNLIYGDLCHQTVFARRRLFERFGRFNLAYRINADYDWLLRVFTGGAKTWYMNRPLANFSFGGLCTNDPERTRVERAQVTRAYVRPAMYALGNFVFRFKRKLRNITGEKDLSRIDGTTD